LALIELSSSVNPLWGYPRGTCRTEISSSDSRPRACAEPIAQSRTRWSIRRRLIMPYRAIASAFLAGEPSVEHLIERATRMLGRPSRLIARAARRFVKTFPPDKPRPRHREVVEFLLRFRGLQTLSVDQWLTESQRMRPVSAAASWPIRDYILYVMVKVV
jgi:hypothetical protein